MMRGNPDVILEAFLEKNPKFKKRQHNLVTCPAIDSVSKIQQVDHIQEILVAMQVLMLPIDSPTIFPYSPELDKEIGYAKENADYHPSKINVEFSEVNEEIVDMEASYLTTFFQKIIVKIIALIKPCFSKLCGIPDALREQLLNVSTNRTHFNSSEDIIFYSKVPKQESVPRRHVATI